MNLASLFNSGAFGFLLEGGIFMWPLLVLLILAVAVMIERWRSLKMLDADSSELRDMVEAAGFRVERFGLFDRFYLSDNMWMVARKPDTVT